MIEILEHKNTSLINPAPKLHLSVQMALTRTERKRSWDDASCSSPNHHEFGWFWILQQSNFLRRKPLSVLCSLEAPWSKFLLPGCKLNKVNRWSGSEWEFHKIPTLFTGCTIESPWKVDDFTGGWSHSVHVAHLKRGMSPACAAAAGRHEEVLDLLLGTTGLNHDQQQWSTIAQWFLNEAIWNCPLESAQTSSHGWMLGMLPLRLEGKADPNLASADGGTPLFMAIQATCENSQSRKTYGRETSGDKASLHQNLKRNHMKSPCHNQNWSILIYVYDAIACHSKIRLIQLSQYLLSETTFSANFSAT